MKKFFECCKKEMPKRLKEVIDPSTMICKATKNVSKFWWITNERTNEERERERERERSNDIDPNVARQNFSRNVNWTFERRRSTFIFRCKFEANASNYYYYDNDYYDDDDNDNDDGAITIRPSDASTNRKFPETGCPVVGSPGLAVMKWDSRSKCFVFESQRILDGHFSHVLFS